MCQSRSHLVSGYLTVLAAWDYLGKKRCECSVRDFFAKTESRICYRTVDLDRHPCETRRLDKGVGIWTARSAQVNKSGVFVCCCCSCCSCRRSGSSLPCRCRRFNLSQPKSPSVPSTALRLDSRAGVISTVEPSLTPTLETGAPTTRRATVQQWNIDRDSNIVSPAIQLDNIHLLARRLVTLLYGNSKLGRPTGRRALPTVLLASLCRLPCSIPGCRPPLISRSGESVLDLESQKASVRSLHPPPGFS